MTLQARFAVGLLFVFLLPVLNIARRSRRTADLDWPRLRRGLLYTWLCWLALVVLIGLRGQISDLGLTLSSFGTLIDGVLFGFVAFGATMLLVGLVSNYLDRGVGDPASVVVLEQPLHRRLAVGVTGAVVETTLFYGFAIQAVVGLGGGQVLAGLVAALGVVLVRARWSLRQALQWVPGAIVLTAITLWSGSVVPVLAIRLVYDVLTVVSGDPSKYGETTSAA